MTSYFGGFWETWEARHDYTFDGTNRLIRINHGITLVNVQEMYTAWKQWSKFTENDNLRYPQAFTVVGGDPTTGDNVITPYFFLMNSWKIKPWEGNHTLQVSGILLTIDQTDAYTNPDQNWRVAIQAVVPIYTETVRVNTELSEQQAYQITKVEKILSNRVEANNENGKMIVYADDNTTPLYTADIFEDNEGNIPYSGGKIERRNRLG
jgi:hypothetical protein